MLPYDITKPQWITTWRPRHNGWHFAGDIFKCIFLKEKSGNSLTQAMPLLDFSFNEIRLKMSSAECQPLLLASVCYWGDLTCYSLTHLPWTKKATISQTIFSDAFSWKKSFVFWLKFPVWNVVWRYLKGCLWMQHVMSRLWCTMLMVWCKTAVTPFLMHSLELLQSSIKSSMCSLYRVINPCCDEFFLQNINIFVFSIIIFWCCYHIGSWDPYSCKTKTHSPDSVNTTAADNLAKYLGAMASAAMALTYLSLNILVSIPRRLTFHSCPNL